MDEVDLGDEFQCSKCGKYFKNEKCLDAHYKKKIPCNRELKCEKCGKEFTHKGHYARHLTDRKTSCTNEQEEKHPCLKCGKLLSSQKRLQNHLEACAKSSDKINIDDTVTLPSGITLTNEDIAMLAEILLPRLLNQLEMKNLDGS